jgi:hypothetical protein
MTLTSTLGETLEGNSADADDRLKESFGDGQAGPGWMEMWSDACQAA